MSSLNKALVAALVVQIALAFVVRAGSDPTTTVGRPEPLLAGIDAKTVTRIAIFDRKNEDTSGDTAGSQTESDADAATEDKPVLEVTRDGEQWNLTSHFGYPAKASAVTSLIDKLAGLRSRGPAVTSQVRHKQLEVASDLYQRKLVIDTGAGTTTLFIGKPAGARQVSLRIDGQDGVHQISGISAAGVSTTVSTWFDSKFFEIPYASVGYMSLRNRANTYEFQRNEFGNWALVSNGQPVTAPPGTKYNIAAAENWVKKAVRIFMSNPADPKRKLDNPLATVVVRLKPEQADDKPAEAGTEASAEAGTEATAGAGTEATAGAGTEATAGAGTEATAGAGDNPGAADAGAATPATSPMVSEAPEEYILEIGEEDSNNYYVRISGGTTAALVRSTNLKALVDLTDDLVFIPAE